MTLGLSVRNLLEHRRTVYGFIFGLTRDVDVAEEIFQDVSVTVLEETAKRLEVDRFVPWVLGVARNRVSDYYRKNRRRSPLPAALEDAVAEAFEQAEESREQAARRVQGLLDCVELLPPRQKQILELRYRDRLPLTGVSTEVGWTVNAAKVALSKIRKTLLACLRAKDLIEGSEPS